MKSFLPIIFLFILFLVSILLVVILKPEQPPRKKVVVRPAVKKTLPPKPNQPERKLFKEPPAAEQLHEDIKELAVEDPKLVARIIKKWLREKVPVGKRR
ncbi:MAG: hypothetical protein V3U37_03885 [Nitrospinaceae bacterium]